MESGLDPLSPLFSYNSGGAEAFTAAEKIPYLDRTQVDTAHPRKSK